MSWTGPLSVPVVSGQLSEQIAGHDGFAIVVWLLYRRDRFLPSPALHDHQPIPLNASENIAIVQDDMRKIGLPLARKTNIAFLHQRIARMMWVAQEERISEIMDLQIQSARRRFEERQGSPIQCIDHTITSGPTSGPFWPPKLFQTLAPPKLFQTLAQQRTAVPSPTVTRGEPLLNRMQPANPAPHLSLQPRFTSPTPPAQSHSALSLKARIESPTSGGTLASVPSSGALNRRPTTINPGQPLSVSAPPLTNQFTRGATIGQQTAWQGTSTNPPLDPRITGSPPVRPPSATVAPPLGRSLSNTLPVFSGLFLPPSTSQSLASRQLPSQGRNVATSSPATAIHPLQQRPAPSPPSTAVISRRSLNADALLPTVPNLERSIFAEGIGSANNGVPVPKPSSTESNNLPPDNASCPTAVLQRTPQYPDYNLNGPLGVIDPWRSTAPPAVESPSHPLPTGSRTDGKRKERESDEASASEVKRPRLQESIAGPGGSVDSRNEDGARGSHANEHPSANTEVVPSQLDSLLPAEMDLDNVQNNGKVVDEWSSRSEPAAAAPQAKLLGRLTDVQAAIVPPASTSHPSSGDHAEEVSFLESLLSEEEEGRRQALEEVVRVNAELEQAKGDHAKEASSLKSQLFEVQAARRKAQEEVTRVSAELEQAKGELNALRSTNRDVNKELRNSKDLLPIRARELESLRMRWSSEPQGVLQRQEEFAQVVSLRKVLEGEKQAALQKEAQWDEMILRLERRDAELDALENRRRHEAFEYEAKVQELEEQLRRREETLMTLRHQELDPAPGERDAVEEGEDMVVPSLQYGGRALLDAIVLLAKLVDDSVEEASSGELDGRSESGDAATSSTSSP